MGPRSYGEGRRKIHAYTKKVTAWSPIIVTTEAGTTARTDKILEAEAERLGQLWEVSPDKPEMWEATAEKTMNPLS